MTATNNPAGRLHALITLGQQKPGATRTADVWAQILDVSKHDTGALLTRVGLVATLPSRIKDAISHIDNLDHDIYLRWFSQAEASFKFLNFEAKWQQFIERFNGETMYGIEICSETLSRMLPEKTIDKKQLSELLSKVNDLLSDIEKTVLDEITRIFILDHLFCIKQAIEEHPISGIKPLETAFEQSAGAIALNPILYQKIRTTEVGKKFWDVMGKLAIVVTVVAGAIQIETHVRSLLPSYYPTQSSEHIMEGKEHEGGKGSNRDNDGDSDGTPIVIAQLPPPS